MNPEQKYIVGSYKNLNIKLEKYLLYNLNNLFIDLKKLVQREENFKELIQFLESIKRQTSNRRGLQNKTYQKRKT